MQWYPEIKHHAEGVPFILVGTKADLRTNCEWSDRIVSEGVTTEEGHKLKEELGAKEYLECSALTQEGLKNVFDVAIRVALSNKTKPRRPRRKCAIL